jgi:AcrR family transcriptional regulator
MAVAACYDFGQMTNLDVGRPDAARGGRGDATRSKIAQATVELVAELGWDAVTTRAVAARAGVNPALVHYHFGSMDVLLRSAVVAALEQEIGPAVASFTEPGSLTDALAGATDALGRFDPATPTSTLLIEAMIRAVRDPDLSRLIVGSLAEFRELVAERVRTASDDEAGANLPPEATGVFVAAAFDGLLLHRIVDPSTDIDGFREVIVRLFQFQQRVPSPGDPPTTSARGGTS